MFQRLLIPPDGSKVARKAIDAGIRFAKEAGASVVGYYAVEAIERIYYAEGRSGRRSTVKALEKSLGKQGEHYLAEIRKAAVAAGVACDTLMTSPATPDQGIIDVARKKKWDVILIA